MGVNTIASIELEINTVKSIPLLQGRFLLATEAASPALRDLLPGTASDGFTLDLVNSQAQAIEALGSHPYAYDALIVAGLPPTNFLNALPTDTKNLPVLVVVAQDDTAAETEAWELGATDVLIREELTKNNLERALRYALENKRLKQEAQFTQDYYRILEQNQNEGVWRVDLKPPVPIDLPAAEQIARFYKDGVMGACNEQMARMYGCEVAHLRELPMGEIMPPTEPLNIDYLHNFIASDYRLSDAETVELDSQGETKHFLNNLAGVIKDGQLLHVWGAQRDITERRRAEAAQRRSEELYQTLVEHFPNGSVYLVDRDARIVLSGGQGMTKVGLSQHEIDGKTLEDVLGGDGSYEAFKAAHERAIQGEEVVTEVEVRGRIRSLYVIPVRQDTGQINLVMAMTQDITERKQMEDALRRSERLYAAFVENFPNGVVMMLDREMRIIIYQGKGVEQLGLRSEAVQGKLYSEVFGHLPVIGPITAMYHQAMAGHEQVTEVEIYGRIRSVHMVPVRDEMGEVSIVLVMTQDITERKRAEVERQESREALQQAYDELEQRVTVRTAELEQLNKVLHGQISERQMVMGTLHETVAQFRQAKTEAEHAREEAERANRAKSEFLSRMSHELRTPLNSILGFAQIMELQFEPEIHAKHIQHLTFVIKAGQHLLQLINEVLDIAHVESGRLSLSPEAVPLTEVVLEAVEMASPLCRQNELQITRVPGACEGVFVYADRQRLSQVLLNLLSNASKYNRHGGEIQVQCDLSDGWVRVGVRDTGHGIAPEQFDRIFLPFERLGAETTSIEGTGLGLALSKRLIEVMGGRMGLESTLGQGSVFWLELPLATDPVQQLESSPPIYRSFEGLTRKHSLLYIEDNLANLQVIEHMLDGEPNIKLVSAMQGLMGLELAREYRPSLILLDLHLPDLPGDEVLKRLHADPQTSGIPVIVISADATPHRVQRLMDQGANYYLTKPLDIRQFIVVLYEALAGCEERD